MPEFTDVIRDGIRGLQVAFDKQWASFRGLMSSTRAGRIMWGTNGPLELEGVERMSLGAAAVLARHDHDLRLPSLRELNPELARLLAQHRRRLYLDVLGSLDALTAKAVDGSGRDPAFTAGGEPVALRVVRGGRDGPMATGTGIAPLSEGPPGTVSQQVFENACGEETVAFQRV
jgi:hypothetical protein